MKDVSPQRRGGRGDDFSFSLPLRRRQRKISMPFRQDLTDWNN